MWRKVFNRKTSNHYDRTPLTVLTLAGLIVLTIGGGLLYSALVEFGWEVVLINISIFLLIVGVIVGGWFLLYFIVGKIMYLIEEHRDQKYEDRRRKFYEDLYKPKADIAKPYMPGQNLPNDGD